MARRGLRCDGAVLLAWRRSRGWDAPEMAANIRRAATDGQVPDQDSLKRMVWRWERGGLTVERYELLYARALGIDPDDLAGGPPDPGSVSKAARGVRPSSAALARAVDDAPGARGEVEAARAAAERRPALAGGPAGGGGPVSSDAVPLGTDDVVIRALLRAALTAGWARGEVLDVDEVERREFLRLAGVVGVSAPLVAGADRVRRNLDGALNAPTTDTDVAEWERVAEQYALESGRVPPAVLLPELLTDLDEAQTRLAGAADALRPPMARVCGYLSAITAVNLLNVGNERDARRYWRTALRTIDLSGDRPSRAMVYAQRAHAALYEGGTSPAAALAVADDAISIAGDTPSAGTARAYAARAEALAYLGDSRESVLAVRKAGEVFTRLPESATVAPDGHGYSEQQVLFMESIVYAYAGRVPDATRALEAGRSLVKDPTPMQSARYELSRVVGLIRAGDPSEGARHVVRVVQVLPDAYQRSSIVRDVASRALDAVPVSAANVPAVAEARELLALPPAAGA